MNELREIADNIVRERCEYSEVQLAFLNHHECAEHVEVEQPVPENKSNAE